MIAIPLAFIAYLSGNISPFPLIDISRTNKSTPSFSPYTRFDQVNTQIPNKVTPNNIKTHHKIHSNKTQNNNQTKNRTQNTNTHDPA